ncbi:MAG TPA: transaldolase [Chloroflexi bacterium]|jgi:transaldolase|nr:transaldolase [Chloroflexota bacterium]
MTTLHALTELGQSVWLDDMRRSYLRSGRLEAFLLQGIRGVTTNPTIFYRAITGSEEYDRQIEDLACIGQSAYQIYEALILEDVGRAADQLRPIYEETGGVDGYVSLEVSPRLARDTRGTIAQAQRLYSTLGRPNVMIKVPGTPQGLPAIRALIAARVNVNVTLLFSLPQYEAVLEAYMAGLEDLAAVNGNLSGVASVASFFVSRIDTAVDAALDTLGYDELKGKAAVASARVAYAHFRAVIEDERWTALAQRGARIQRPLWASTSTKNPDYPDTLYVDSLIGPDTVTSLPVPTIEAFLAHGTVSNTLDDGLDEARDYLAQLVDLGIDLTAVGERLQDDGITAFVESFDALQDAIAEKRIACADVSNGHQS